MGISPPRLPDLNDPTGPTEPGTSRRGFLGRVAVGGAALAVGSQIVPVPGLAGIAGAQEEDGDAELTEDEKLVAHLASLSLAATQAYAQAVDPETSPLPEPVVEIVRVFGVNHSAQAAALNALLPVAVENPNATYQEELGIEVSLASDLNTMLAVLRQMEESIAATHYVALGAIEDQNDAKTVAAAMPVVGQQAVVLGSLAEVPAAELVPDQQGATGNLPITSYPTGVPGTAEEVPSNGPLGSPGGAGPEVGEPNSVDGGEG
ncbi:MAG: twin-arginine translocation signal domain-containing protein [Iamia sp.]